MAAAAAARVLINQVTGAINPSNNVWVTPVNRVVNTDDETEELVVIPFQIPARYTNLRWLLGGTDTTRGDSPQEVHGVSAFDETENKRVAIRKNTGLLMNISHAWSVIKEIRFYRKTKKRFLHLFGTLQDILLPMEMGFLNSKIFDSYLVYRLEIDTLSLDEYIAYIHSQGPSSSSSSSSSSSFSFSFSNMKKQHIQGIVTQLLLVVLYFHSRKIQHRELVSSSITVCPHHPDLPFKVQVFGAGSYGLVSDGGGIQRNIDDWVLRHETSIARMYRPPESLLGISRYGEEYDMWSIGCIFAKLLISEDVFGWKNNEDLLEKILNVLGDLNPMDVDFIVAADNEKANMFKKASLEIYNSGSSIFRMPSFPTIVPCSDEFNLLTKMLKFNPEHRICVEAALNHPFIQEFISSNPVVQKWLDEILQKCEASKQQGEDTEEEEEDEEDEMISAADPEVVRKTLLREQYLFFNPSVVSFT